MFAKDKRITLLINISIIAVLLIVMLLVRELFGNAIGLFMTAFTAILLPFSIALFISYLVAPVFQLLERRLRFKYRLMNTVIVFVGIGVLLFFFGRFAGVLIYEQGVAFVENDWPRIVEIFEARFGEGTMFEQAYVWFTEWFQIGDTERITLDLFAILRSVTTVVLTIVLVPVFLFFILNDRKRIFEGFVVLFPPKWRTHVIELAKRAHRVVESYFNGRFLTMLVMAVFFTALLLILGFKERAVLFGFMLGFFDIVPYVGPFIAIILPVLYSLTEPDLLFGQFAPVAILIANVIGQMIQNNVAQPLIMGKETKIHPLLVLSAFVFFGYLLGVVGLILAIPITGMIKTTVSYIKERHDDRVTLNESEREKIQEDAQ